MIDLLAKTLKYDLWRFWVKVRVAFEHNRRRKGTDEQFFDDSVSEFPSDRPANSLANDFFEILAAWRTRL